MPPQVFTCKRLPMDTRSSRSDRPSTFEPGDVPFLGWSRVAHEFRLKAAEMAPGGFFSPLIVGDPGVGKRTMAYVWRRVAGQSQEERPIIDLDTWGDVLPDRCIATTKRPPSDRPCFLLEKGTWGMHPSDRRASPPCLPTSCSGSRSRCTSRPSTVIARSTY